MTSEGQQPDAAHDTVVSFARRAIEQRLDEVMRLAPLAAAEGRHDPELVHQLRVATRRSVAALETFASFLPRRQLRRMRRRLRRIRRAADRARDCDVMTERLAEGHRRRNRVVQKLGHRERAKAQSPIARITRRLVDSGKLAGASRKLLESLARSDYAHMPFEGWAKGLLQDRVDAFFAEAALDTVDVEGLHRLRIRAKKLRYAIEILDASEPPGRSASLAELQDRLGTINDHAAALARLKRWRKRSSKRGKRRSLRALARLEEAELEAGVAAFSAWWTPRQRGALHQSLRGERPPS